MTTTAAITLLAGNSTVTIAAADRGGRRRARPRRRRRTRLRKSQWVRLSMPSGTASKDSFRQSHFWDAAAGPGAPGSHAGGKASLGRPRFSSVDVEIEFHWPACPPSLFNFAGTRHRSRARLATRPSTWAGHGRSQLEPLHGRRISAGESASSPHLVSTPPDFNAITLGQRFAKRCRRQ